MGQTERAARDDDRFTDRYGIDGTRAAGDHREPVAQAGQDVGFLWSPGLEVDRLEHGCAGDAARPDDADRQLKRIDDVLGQRAALQYAELGVDPGRSRGQTRNE